MNLTTPYFQNRAIFKGRLSEQHRAGSGMVTIPKVEADFQDWDKGDEVDSIIATPISDTLLVSRNKSLVRSGTGVALTYSKEELSEFDEGITGRIVQFIVSDADIISLSERTISFIKNILFDNAVFKDKLKVTGRRTLHSTIPINEVQTVNIEKNDSIDVVLIKLDGDNNIPLRRRSRFRVNTARAGNSIRFHIPAARVRLKDYSEGDIVQALVRPVR